MRILVITPAPPGSLKGNRVTAERWSRLLGELGHEVAIEESYRGQPCDVLVALHARRSAGSIRRLRDGRPDAPLVVALTGTDLYRDVEVSEEARRSLELASRLVALEDVEALKGRALRHVELTFPERVDPREFEGLAGVRRLTPSPDGLRLTLEVSGRVEAVIAAAARLSATDLVSHEAELEEIFLAHYGQTHDDAA